MTDREKLIRILSVPIYPRIGTDPAEVVADYLMDNDVSPVRHAHWIPAMNCEVYSCSNCGGEHDCQYAFCHYCGAKMDEVTGNAE